MAWTASARTDSRWSRGVEAAYLGHTSVRSRLDVPTKTTIKKNYIEKIGVQVETADHIDNVMSFC